VLFFFFSSRRRHTRSKRDWSSDVCSSDLVQHGVLIGLGLVVLDVPFAVPIAALTFLGAYVPLIGATLAGAVAVAVALFSGGLGTAVWTLVIVLVVQQVEGNVITPLLMAGAVCFPPLGDLSLTT